MIQGHQKLILIFIIELENKSCSWDQKEIKIRKSSQPRRWLTFDDAVFHGGGIMWIVGDWGGDCSVGMSCVWIILNLLPGFASLPSLFVESTEWRLSAAGLVLFTLRLWRRSVRLFPGVDAERLERFLRLMAWLSMRCGRVKGFWWWNVTAERDPRRAWSNLMSSSNWERLWIVCWIEMFNKSNVRFCQIVNVYINFLG